jgi:ABC-type transport system substrate-binding protein
MKTKKFLVLALLTILTLVVSACAPAAGGPGAAPAAAPAAGEEAAVSGDEYSTPHPILSDLNVRTAIANCLDRDALIASVYPYVEDPASLRMDSWIPNTQWAYSGPYEFPQYDPEAGKALLDEAGWTLAEGADVRTNADGDALSIKLTTTNAQFRQTWTAVAIQQLAECGIQIIPTYAPASWWFGDTTGLARRDFELGAYAWVGQAEPAGRSLYACDQIPVPGNNWEGQNYMGWCNEAANNAIIKATNSLTRDERIPAYDAHQQEFAKDVVSIPVFARAEAEAWSANLEGPDPDATEYTTWNLPEWRLTDGGDTIVIGMTQEPDSLWQAVSTMAASALVRKATGDLGGGDNARIYFQREYDFQPWLQDQLSTIEAGFATNNDIEVAAGDTVYDITGQPVPLEQGTKVFDSTGTEVEYDGSSPLTMKQLVVTYPFQDYTWSDGEPGKIADFELSYKIDCDPTGGAAGYVTCESIQGIEFSQDALEYTATYLPGVQSPTYFLPPFGPYPSHQVLADGRNLADVPAAEWATLPEIAERPLSWGPYMVTDWVKGQSLTLAANPNYAGEVAVPNVIFVFVADTNQAVAQLLNGDVDFLDDSTLGAGAEVQTVIDAANSGSPVKYEIAGAPTWEHIDINLYTK